MRPSFPTVAFPNPEEPGATDALLALASDVDADLAVALDPDGDRCALGVPTSDGDWRMLSGDACRRRAVFLVISRGVAPALQRSEGFSLPPPLDPSLRPG